MTTLERTRSSTVDVIGWMNLIRAEYAEMPGLSLTLSQVERLWNLRQEAAETLLCELQRVKFLQRTHKGTYVRADLGCS